MTLRSWATFKKELDSCPNYIGIAFLTRGGKVRSMMQWDVRVRLLWIFSACQHQDAMTTMVPKICSLTLKTNRSNILVHSLQLFLKTELLPTMCVIGWLLYDLESVLEVTTWQFWRYLPSPQFEDRVSYSPHQLVKMDNNCLSHREPWLYL